jgi:hypothetical protein
VAANPWAADFVSIDLPVRSLHANSREQRTIMKLLYCPECLDVKKLRMLRLRSCSCGQSWGYYLEDDYTAEIGGKTILIAIANDELRDAVAARPETGEPGKLPAMILPRRCEAVRYRQQPDSAISTDGG